MRKYKVSFKDSARNDLVFDADGFYEESGDYIFYLKKNGTRKKVLWVPRESVLYISRED